MGAAKGAGLFIQLFGLYIYNNVLGRVAFGVCTTLLSLQRFATLFDGSMLESTNRQMAAAWAQDDEAQALLVWNTHKRIMLVASGFMIAFYVLLGFFFPLKEYRVPAGESLVFLFAIAGLFVALQYCLSSYSQWFASRKQFKQVSIGYTISSFVGSTSSILLVIWLKRPHGYFYGMIIGFLAAFLFLYWKRRGQPSSRNVPKFDKAVFREAKIFGFKALSNKIAGAFGNGADKLVIQQHLGEAALGTYYNSARVPEAAYDALPLYTIISPELVGAKQVGEEAFTHAINDCCRVAMLIGVCAIMIPCSFGYGILPYILSKGWSPVMPFIMALIGIYRLFECFYSAIAVIIYAGGKPEKIIPYTLWNGAVTLTVSLPAVIYAGLAGIAVMNVSIMLLQFIPLTRMTLREFAPTTDRRRFFGDMGGMFTIGLVCTAIGWLVSRQAYIAGYGWASLFLAPVLMVGALLLIVFARFSTTPAFLKKRFAWLP